MSGPRLLGLDVDRLRAGGGLVTAEEIAQQPALWRQLPGVLQAHGLQLRARLGPWLSRPDLRIVLTGAGTSAFIGEILAPALTRATGRRVDAVATTDLVSSPDSYLAEDRPTLLVSFARSGDSPESAAATQLADEYLSECHHLVLTCNPAGLLARRHDGSDRSVVLVMPAAANDLGFAMTSSFTCMLLSALLALAPELLPVGALELLVGQAELALAAGGEFASRLTGRGFERVVYLGSGSLAGLARESALKMLELTAGRVATWHDSPLGFRHGPKSVINDGTLVVVYVSADPYTRQYDRDIVAELRGSMNPSSVVALTGPVLVDSVLVDSVSGGAVSGDTVPTGSASVGRVPAGPGEVDRQPLDELDDAARSVVLVVLAQIIALHHALALGLTPDNPFPSGAVNRVVEGVTIHPHPA